MKCTIAAILVIIAAPCMAQDFPSLHSLWRETQHLRWCFEITSISEKLPRSDNCVQIAGSLKGAGSLISGYACSTGSIINLFSGIESDNAIGPDVLIGRYSSEKIELQYCTRMSNDWPPDYNCETSIRFDRVTSCDP